MRFVCSCLLLLMACLVSCSDDDDTTAPIVPAANPVSWVTSRVRLDADHFFTVADGDTFWAKDQNIDIGSDYGDSTYCSLEIEWEENGVDMRLYMYFHADSISWWSDEIRTYDGQTNPDWLEYTGTFFETPLGQTFTGDFARECDTGGPYTGRLHFDGLSLRPFMQ
jgi:hypothetical protein